MLSRFTFGSSSIGRLQRLSCARIATETRAKDAGVKNVETGKFQSRAKNNVLVRYENKSPLLFQWTQQVVNGEITVADLEKSTEFQEAEKVICDTTRHSDKNILNLLKSVVIMGLNPESRMVKYLENELLFKLDKYDLRLLINTYEIYGNIQVQSPLRKKIASSIVRNMVERLENTEANLADIILLIRLSRNFPPNILIQIDQQATRYLDYHDDISLDSLCYLLVLLSRFNRRNKPLIRTVVSKLLQFKTEDVYTMPPHLINMLSALSRLSYYEVNLIEKSVDILIKFDFLASNNDSSKRDFIVAISQFNFYYPKLIEYYMQTLVDKPELFKRQDLITLVITLARLNCQHQDVIEVIQSNIVPKLSDSSEFSSKHQWFNYVNSLAFLNIATPDQLKSLLSVEAFKELEGDEAKHYTEKLRSREPEASSVPDVKDLYQVMSLRRKWLSFVGLCKIRAEQYEQLFDSESQREEFEEFVNSIEFEALKKSKDLDSFRGKIQKLMESIAPKDEFFLFDKKIPYGFSIDAELIVNSEGQPQKLTEKNPEFKKIALMCVGFNDTLLESSSELIGPKETEFRILRSLGYVVVPVHQNLISPGTTSLGKVKFVQNLIVSHLRESPIPADE